MRTFYLFCFTLLSVNAFSQKASVKPYEVSISNVKKKISCWKDLSIKYRVIIHSDSGIHVPKNIWLSHLHYPAGDFLLEAQIKTNAGYRSLNAGSLIDNWSFQDSIYILKKNEELNDEENISTHFSFKRNSHYRFRIWYHASKFNLLEDISSNWIYFKILNDNLRRPCDMNDSGKHQ